MSGGSPDTGDPRCPRCGVALAPIPRTPVLTYRCPGCDGRAATLAALRREHDSPELTELWFQARRASPAGGLACPTCPSSMKRVALDPRGLAIELDVCTICETIWLDPGELERLPVTPRPTSPPDPLLPGAEDALVDARVRGYLAHQRSLAHAQQVGTALEWLCVLVGWWA